MSVNASLYSSSSGEWETPQAFFDELDKEFHFTLDPCCTKQNAKCRKFFTKKEDGLAQSWAGERVFMNPPYGREIVHWVRRASYIVSPPDAAEIVVALLPARTDTKWFHAYVKDMADEIRFIQGRLRFGGSLNSAPFPSMVVIWR